MPCGLVGSCDLGTPKSLGSCLESSNYIPLSSGSASAAPECVVGKCGDLVTGSVAQIVSLGTYLPIWCVKGGTEPRRVRGPDEDALTMAVAAGRAADPGAAARRVVLVSRDLPLLEGGNSGVLLAGLSLPSDVQVTEVLGGAPAVLDEIIGAQAGTLVIGSEDSDQAVGAGAVLLGAQGSSIVLSARQTRSLPVIVRHQDGSRHDYGDARLQRDVGVGSTLARLRLTDAAEIVALAGISGRQVSALADPVTEERGSSAASLIRALAGAIENGKPGLVLAVEQSSATAALLQPGDTAVRRDEAQPREAPRWTSTPGPGIPISLASYARAFESKLRWAGAVYEDDEGRVTTPQIPPRARIDTNGRLVRDYRLEPLPRTGTVYSHTTVTIPVPDLATPYSLALVQLDGVDVRVLMKVTGARAGEVTMGEQGKVVLRRLATRTGVPDYGHAFLPLGTKPIEQDDSSDTRSGR